MLTSLPIMMMLMPDQAGASNPFTLPAGQQGSTRNPDYIQLTSGGFTPFQAFPAGMPNPGNLLGLMPLRWGERYEIGSVNIGWSALLDSGGVALTAINAEVDLLINSQTRLRLTDSPAHIVPGGHGAISWSAGWGSFQADLVNPLEIGRYDTLSLLMGVSCSADSTWNPNPDSYMSLGTQAYQLDSGAFQLSPYESTISYEKVSDQ